MGDFTHLTYEKKYHLISIYFEFWWLGYDPYLIAEDNAIYGRDLIVGRVHR